MVSDEKLLSTVKALQVLSSEMKFMLSELVDLYLEWVGGRDVVLKVLLIIQWLLKIYCTDLGSFFIHRKTWIVTPENRREW